MRCLPIATVLVLAACGGASSPPHAPAPAAPADPGDEPASALTGVLASEGDSGMDGHVAPGADLQAQLEEVRREGDQVAVSAEDGDPAGARARPRHGVVTVEGVVALDRTSLTAAAVEEKVRSTYANGVRRCYDAAREGDATLAGTLAVELTATEGKRTTDITVSAPTPALQACVEEQVRAWWFDRPADDDGEPTSAAFRVTIQLAPPA